MSVKIIKRITPAYLQQIQIQGNVTVNGLLSNVIQSLQFNKEQTDLQHPLNTLCPTCLQKGYLSGTFKGLTVKYPCPTCFGFLRYYTQGGQLQPLTNPFNTVLVTIILPADIQELIDNFVDCTTLSGAVIALQGNYTTPPTNNCPVCSHTGWVLFNNVKKICWLCIGVQKTVNLYTYDNNTLVRVLVPPVLPNPLIPPPLPS